MQIASASNNTKIFILVFLVIVEVMGIGIVFPLLPELFIAQTSPLLAINTTEVMRHIFYGLSISLWPLGMFFGIPYLGELSDKFGRKKILLICMLMTAVCYVLLAGSVYLHSLWLFLSCRFFAGCFAGCYEIAQAATADISTPETKARNMGWVSLALSVGFIFGPLITAFSTSSASFFSHSLTAPFWIAAGISSSNAILISLFLPETFVSQAEKKIKLSKIFSSFLFVFTDRRLTYLSIIFLCLVGGWMGFFTVLPLYLSNVFHFEVSRVALFYCIIGVSCVTSIFLVQSRVIKYFSLPKIITYSAFICAAILVLLSAFSSIWLFGVFLAIFAIIEMLTYSCFLVYFSNAVTPDEQGQAMGGSGATSSVAFIFCSFVTAMLANYDARLIFVFSALLFFLIGILMLRKLKT